MTKDRGIWRRPGIHWMGMYAGLGLTGVGIMDSALGNLSTGVPTALFGLLGMGVTWAFVNAMANRGGTHD